MFDSILTYDKLEREALKTLPNRALQAFGCFAFNQFGYPSRVGDASELWRFIDVMHEGNFEHHLKVLRWVSEEELELASWLAKGTFEYSTRNFGRPLTGRHCITAALIQLRGMRRIEALPKTTRVLELGPGSGFLSLLMAKVGYAVDTVEVSQAFALHQAHFFKHFLPESSASFADSQYEFDPSAAPELGCIRQIPWWSYGDNGPITQNYDLLTANHALAEFHPDGLLYMMKRFGAMHFARWGRSPIIFADTFGYAVTPYQTIEARLNQYGWVFDRHAPFYFIQYDPSRALQQAIDIEQKTRYEGTVRRKVKRWLYLALYERANASRGTKKLPDVNDASLGQLREVFDALVPEERTPDEMYIEARN